MIGCLDRYVGRTVLASYLATLLFVVLLWIIMDLLMSMGTYLEVADNHDLTLVEVLALWVRFQLVSMPWIFVLLAPFVTVISSMFSVARLMAANEVVPMVFTGRSMPRILAPVLVTGVLSAASMAVAWEFLLPRLAPTMGRLARTLDKDDGTGSATSVVLFSPDRRMRLMCDRYVPDHQRMEGVVVMDTGSQETDLSAIKASQGTWHPERQDWELVEGVLISGQHRRPHEWLGMEGVTPDMLWLSVKDARESFLLSYTEVMQLITLSPGRPDLVISLHYHMTWPLANIVLLLLALPFAVQFERGSRVGRIVLAVSICGAYLLVDLTCQNLGRNEWLHPVLAAWTPTILFGSLGLVMSGGVRT